MRRRRSYREKLHSGDEQEQYAMRFALALLMPEKQLRAFVATHGPEPVLVSLAFDVPAEAARLRLEQLDLAKEPQP